MCLIKKKISRNYVEKRIIMSSIGCSFKRQIRENVKYPAVFTLQVKKEKKGIKEDKREINGTTTPKNSLND